jgi:hypothetical protein
MHDDRRITRAGPVYPTLKHRQMRINAGGLGTFADTPLTQGAGTVMMLASMKVLGVMED